MIDDENGDWDNRAQLFLKMIGGNSINDATIDYIADKIASFGEIYLIQRKKEGESFSMLEATSHLNGASKEIAKIFVHTLQNSSSLSASLDPDPTPKGEPYKKYKIAKKADEIKQKLKDWIKN